MSWLINSIVTGVSNLLPVDKQEQERLGNIKLFCEKAEIGCKVAIASSLSFAYLSYSFVFPLSYCFGAPMILSGVSAGLVSHDFMQIFQKIKQSPNILPPFEKIEEFMNAMQNCTKGNSSFFNDIGTTIQKIDETASSLVKDASAITRAVSNDLRELVTGWMLVGASAKVDTNFLQKKIGMEEAPHLKHLQDGLSRVMHAVEGVFSQISALFFLNAVMMLAITAYSWLPMFMFSSAVGCALIACLLRDLSLVSRNINSEVIHHEGVNAVASISEGFGIMGAAKTAYYGATNLTTSASLTTLTTLFNSQDNAHFKKNMNDFLASCSFDLFEKLLKETSPLINNSMTRKYFKNLIETAKQSSTTG